MLQALEKSLGVVTPAAKAVDICRETHYRWMEEDPEYKKAVYALDDVALDFAESKLHTNINKGDTTATIFYLKTKGKRRGYIEKSEIDHTTKGDKIEPTTNVFNITGSELDDQLHNRLSKGSDVK